MKRKKLLAFILSAVMTMPLLPTFGLTASADETETSTATEKNVTLGSSALSGYDGENKSYKYSITAHTKTPPLNGVFSL